MHVCVCACAMGDLGSKICHVLYCRNCKGREMTKLGPKSWVHESCRDPSRGSDAPEKAEKSGMAESGSSKNAARRRKCIVSKTCSGPLDIDDLVQLAEKEPSLSKASLYNLFVLAGRRHNTTSPFSSCICLETAFPRGFTLARDQQTEFH